MVVGRLSLPPTRVVPKTGFTEFGVSVDPHSSSYDQNEHGTIHELKITVRPEDDRSVSDLYRSTYGYATPPTEVCGDLNDRTQFRHGSAEAVLTIRAVHTYTSIVRRGVAEHDVFS